MNEVNGEGETSLGGAGADQTGKGLKLLARNLDFTEQAGRSLEGPGPECDDEAFITSPLTAPGRGQPVQERESKPQTSYCL